MTAATTSAVPTAPIESRDPHARFETPVRALRPGDRLTPSAGLDLRPVSPPPRRARGARATSQAHRALSQSRRPSSRQDPRDPHTRPPAAEGGEDAPDALRRQLRRTRRQHPCVRAARSRANASRVRHRLRGQRGYRVLATATFALVQRLLAAKRDLHLEGLAMLDKATRSSSTTSATCSRAATRWRSSSPSSRSATSGAPSSSRATSSSASGTGSSGTP